MGRYRVVWARLIIAIIFLGIWQLYGSVSTRGFFLVAKPTAVMAAFGHLLMHGSLAYHFLITGFEAVSGLLLGTVMGATGGLLLWYSKSVATTMRPFIVALATLPVFALAPLMIVWFGIGLKMKIVMAVFATVFVAFDQSYYGALGISRDSVDVVMGMRGSRGHLFWKVLVPGSLDALLSSLRLNVGFSLLGAFIGEFIASDRGLGFLILRASSLYNVPRALAAACGITILALALNSAAAFAESHRYRIVELLSVPRTIWRRNVHA
jgi:NitT/TauT family transport system permease protein